MGILKKFSVGQLMVLVALSTICVLSFLGLALVGYDTVLKTPGSQITIESTPIVDSSTNVPDTPTSVGIGVSRRELQLLFEEVGFFTFEDSSPVNGAPRVFGRSENEMVLLELIGPAGELTSAGIVAFLPYDFPDVAISNGLAVTLLINKVDPLWGESIDWLAEQLEAAGNMAPDDYENTIEVNGIKYEFSFSPPLGMVILNISSV